MRARREEIPRGRPAAHPGLLPTELAAASGRWGLPTCQPCLEVLVVLLRGRGGRLLVRLGVLRLLRLLRLLRVGAAVRARLGRALAGVVGGVEAGALEVHRNGVEDSLDRRAALLARGHGIVRDRLEDLELMTVAAAVLVDRHAIRLSQPAPAALGTRNLRSARRSTRRLAGLGTPRGAAIRASSSPEQAVSVP